jgi:hypothetical protein
LSDRQERDFDSSDVIERCVGGSKQKDFWPTIKPFITNKGSYFENNIILTDDDRIINDMDLASICVIQLKL